MALLDFFRGKKPTNVPPLAEATARLEETREQHASNVATFKQVEAALGQAMLDRDEVATARLRKDHRAAETAVSESALMVAAAETVHAAARDAENTEDERTRKAAINAKLDERHAGAVQFDEQLDVLAGLVHRLNAIHGDLRLLNPAASVPLPNGLSTDHLLRIISFRLTYKPGDTFSPFRTLEESKVAHYLPPSNEKDRQ